jgi:hypothetical protein
MRRLWLIFAAAFFFLNPAMADDAYPSRPVHLIVPAAPGGSFDILARILANGLSERWHRSVIVDNRAGGGGNIGALAVSKAEPDGYTLLVWNDSLLINPTLLPDTPFDPKKDFTPISLSIYVPNVLVAHPSTGFHSFADFLKAARANPGQMSYGSPGNGSPGHLSFELLKQLANIDVFARAILRRRTSHQRSRRRPHANWHDRDSRRHRVHSRRYAYCAWGNLRSTGCGSAASPANSAGRFICLSDQCLARHSRARQNVTCVGKAAGAGY